MLINKNHSFVCPTRMVHGVNIIEQLASEAKALNAGKLLVVTDRGIADCGILDKALQVLKNDSVEFTVFDAVEANPATDTVASGTELYRKENCQGLLGLGGGSSMDTAKAIGVEIAEGEPVVNFECAPGKKELSRRIPPLICVPTTAGTGSEVTLWAVITDRQRQYKFNVGGVHIAAHVALIDPMLQLSLPAELTMSTGMDALCHAIECYTGAYAQPITDAFAYQAIELAGKYLRRAVAYGEDIEARYQMAMCSMLAGLSYGLESAGAVHALTQTLGGIYPVAHGLAVAATLAPVMEYNWLGKPDKYARIAGAMGEDIRGLSENEAAKLAVEAVKSLAGDIGVPNLKNMGIKKEDIPRLAVEAFNDPQTIGNPRDLTVKAYEAIYERAYAIVY